MHGNVREWCGDWCSGTYYQYCLDNLIVDDPQGPVSGVTRVTRGGSYCDFGSDCRSAYRAAWDPTWCRRYVGFRLVSVGL
jgi:formylglycine-generating enzyme required for sulfatase activity